MKTNSILARACIQTLEDRRMFNFGPPVDYAAGSSPNATVVADLNGDTRPDIAVANYSSSNVSVLLGNADGTFQPAQSSATGAGPSSLAVGDFNGDGKVDLVTANTNNLSVLIGNGNGTYHAPVSVDIGSLPSSVAVGDFNADGKLDLAVASSVYYPPYYGTYGSYPAYYNGRANVLLGNGSGSFAPATATYLGSGSNSSSTAVADFNGDGKLDFAAGSISVLTGNGSGGLSVSTGVYVGGYVTSLVARDVNGDGKADLVAATPGTNVLQVALGNGVGGFGTVQNLPTGAGPSSVAVADFNTDGKLDLLSTNSDGTISVLLGAGSGTFKPAVSLAHTAGTHVVAAGDFNGDGRPDAAISNGSTNNLSVLLNDGSWIAITAPSITIANAADVTEGNTGTTNSTFTVTLSAASTQTVTLHFATADGSATLAGGDYVATSGNLSFAPGQTSQSITVPVNGDRVGEANEGFSVRLTDAANAFVAGAIGFGTIVDDEPRMTIDANASVTEGNAGTTPMNFTVHLAATYDAPVTVNYSTVEGDTDTWNYDYYYTYPPDPATSGVDFQGQTGTLTFAPGQTAKTIAVLVNGDHTFETNEGFSVNLDTPTGGAVFTGANAYGFAGAHGLGTIIDDEPYVSLTGGSVVEGNSGTVPLTFTATLSAASDVPVTATYATADNTARSTTDYVAATGTVTFAPGQTTRTFTVDIRGDLVPEYTESVVVNLTGSTNAGIVNGQAFGTITDTDPDPTISIANVTRAEGKSGSETPFKFILSLSTRSEKIVSVHFKTASGTATSSGSNKDYYADDEYTSIYPDQLYGSATIYVIGDNRNESDETFFVNLSGPDNATIAHSQGVGTIINDETRGKTWVGAASGGNWSTSSNWSPSGVPVATSLVRIDGASVTASASVSVDELSLLNYATLTVAPNASRVLRTSRLFIADDSKLDLNDGALVLTSQPLSAVANYLGTGYANGAWNGNGICSSLAGSTPQRALGYAAASDLFGTFPATFQGQSVNASDALIRYTFSGDANLDGRVNSVDFTSIAMHFNQSDQRWSQGDSNYDATVNALDFNALASNHGSSLAAGSTAPAELSSELISAQSVAAAPPGTLFSRDRIKRVEQVEVDDSFV